jgi:uncharacterized protein YraI
MTTNRPLRGPHGLHGRWLFVLLLVLPFSAWAQMAHTLRAVNVRAGPDAVFPLVTRLSSAASVHIVGCLEDGRWCDVVAGRTRGWVYASYLSYPFRSQRPPVIAFSVEEYWDAHYRRRPWFAARDEWLGWGTPSFRPPPR